MLVETIWFTISSMPIVSLTARICSLDCFLRLFDAIVDNKWTDVCSRPFNERHTFYTRYKFTMNFERGGGGWAWRSHTYHSSSLYSQCHIELSIPWYEQTIFSRKLKPQKATECLLIESCVDNTSLKLPRGIKINHVKVNCFKSD